MKIFGTTGAPGRALAALTGSALLAGLLVTPAAAAPAALPESAPPTTTVNGELCTDEPVWFHGDGSRATLTWGSTFEEPTPATALMYTIVRPDGVVVDRWPAAIEGGVASLTRDLPADHDTVYTLETRLRVDGELAEEPVASCRFGIRQPPSVSTIPVLGEEAVYVAGEPRGGVGVPGRFLVNHTRGGDAVTVEYALTGSTTRPTAWETVPVPGAGPLTVPVVPTVSGTRYLHVRGVDRYGVPGPVTRRTLRVAAAGEAEPTPPAVTLADVEDTTPGDGRIPVTATLTEDLGGWPMGDLVVLYQGHELGRAAMTAPAQTVPLEQALLGTGFRDVTVEYRQFEGAPLVTTTARLCGGDCAFSGGRATITALGGVRLDPNLKAEVSGFSPAPTSYEYEWLSAGKVVATETDDNPYYLSLPRDEKHTLTLRVTATGPRMVPKTVSTSVVIGDRPEPQVCATGKAVGTSWSDSYGFCRPHGVAEVGDPGSGDALEMITAHPWPAGYSFSEGEPAAGDPILPDYWFAMKGYVQGRGWQGLQRKGDVHYIGSVGENRRLEAFRIDDGGVLAPYYDVWYRAWVPKHGWLGWAKNGENAGTVGYGYRIEAVQVRLLPHGTSPSASGTGAAPFYEKATQDQVTVEPWMRPVGWRKLVHGGSTAGLTDTSQRLNAVRVHVKGRSDSGSVQVAAKVEGDGWRSYVGDSKVAGTFHASNRTSAYKMRLTGEMAKQYDIYYRVHVAGKGWLGWARNGSGAGTESYSYRNTAVQVVLVKKGERALMSGYDRPAYLR